MQPVMVWSAAYERIKGGCLEEAAPERNLGRLVEVNQMTNEGQGNSDKENSTAGGSGRGRTAEETETSITGTRTPGSLGSYGLPPHFQALFLERWCMGQWYFGTCLQEAYGRMAKPASVPAGTMDTAMSGGDRA